MYNTNFINSNSCKSSTCLRHYRFKSFPQIVSIYLKPVCISKNLNFLSNDIVLIPMIFFLSKYCIKFNIDNLI